MRFYKRNNDDFLAMQSINKEKLYIKRFLNVQTTSSLEFKWRLSRYTRYSVEFVQFIIGIGGLNLYRIAF